jgi:pyruvate/2-oxoglutarate dehydrogenase complex dihydrolipoamide acyltransferase (E2) component
MPHLPPLQLNLRLCQQSIQPLQKLNKMCLTQVEQCASSSCFYSRITSPNSSFSKSAAAPPAATVPHHQPSLPISRALCSSGLPHASPSVRKFARELGVPLSEVKGSGLKGRIT